MTRIKNDIFKGNQIYILMSLSIIFFIGMISVFGRAPFSWYDEQNHYAKVISYSNFDFSRSSGTISSGQEEFINTGMQDIAHSLGGYTEEVIGFDWIEEYSSLKNSATTVASDLTTSASIYTPIVYFPYILAGWISKFLTFNIVTEFILMRLLGFLVSFLIFAYAIKVTPVGKFPLSILGLLPTLVLSMTAVSADSLSNSMIILFLAYTLKIYSTLMDTHKLSNKDLVKYTLISLIVVFSKMPSFVVLGLYFPLIYLLYKTKTEKKKALILSFLFGIFLLSTVTWALISTPKIPVENLPTDTGQQIKFILSDIFNFIKILFKSILYYPFADMQMGYSDIHSVYSRMPMLLSVIYFGALAFSCSFRIIGEKILKNTNVLKVMYILRVLMIAFVVLFTFFTMYIKFSKVGSLEVSGVQPRYFYIYLALLFPVSNADMNNSKGMLTVWICSALPVIYYLFLFLLQIQ